MSAAETFKRTVINLFIVFHLLALLSWSVPLNSNLIPNLKLAYEPYMLWSGLFQTWDMFSPDPPTINAYLEAQVTYRDGHSIIWKFPKMQDLSLVQRYFKERYRKWGNERVRLDANAILWPDAARYIARLNNTNPADPPFIVKLIRYWSDIPPPHSGPTPPPVWNHYVFYVQVISPGDLS